MGGSAARCALASSALRTTLSVDQPAAAPSLAPEAEVRALAAAAPPWSEPGRDEGRAATRGGVGRLAICTGRVCGKAAGMPPPP